MKTLNRHIISGLIFIFAITSCDYDKLANIDNNLTISPTYAFPIGDTSLTNILTLFPDLDTIPIEINDTIPIDSINTDTVFIFNNKAYQMPEKVYFDTFLVIPFFLNFDQPDLIKELTIRVNTENTIPSEGKMVIHFLEGTNISLSLFSDTLDVPVTDPGILNVNDSDLLTEEDIQRLFSATSVLIYYGFTLENATTGIIYYPEQYFRVQLGVRVKVEEEVGE